MSVMRAATNAAAAGSAALTKILNGFIQKVATESSSDWGDPMYKIGDSVVYLPDGSKGIVLEIGESIYHVVWEDHFASWEKEELLQPVE
jgi:hypothetical protein